MLKCAHTYALSAYCDTTLYYIIICLITGFCLLTGESWHLIIIYAYVYVSVFKTGHFMHILVCVCQVVLFSGVALSAALDSLGQCVSMVSKSVSKDDGCDRTVSSDRIIHSDIVLIGTSRSGGTVVPADCSFRRNVQSGRSFRLYPQCYRLVSIVSLIDLFRYYYYITNSHSRIVNRVFGCYST